MFTFNFFEQLLFALSTTNGGKFFIARILFFLFLDYFHLIWSIDILEQLSCGEDDDFDSMMVTFSLPIYFIIIGFEATRQLTKARMLGLLSLVWLFGQRLGCLKSF